MGEEEGICEYRSMTQAPEGDPMQIQLTAVVQRVPEGYVAFVEELPGARHRGKLK